jgi:hypothetical protein
MIPGDEFLLKHFRSSFSLRRPEGRILLRLLPGNSSRPYKKRHSLLPSVVKALESRSLRFEDVYFGVESGACNTIRVFILHVFLYSLHHVVL